YHSVPVGGLLIWKTPAHTLPRRISVVLSPLLKPRERCRSLGGLGGRQEDVEEHRCWKKKERERERARRTRRVSILARTAFRPSCLSILSRLPLSPVSFFSSL
uniref:Uncharacterized protein n=1 Tax=Salarias fasciatus TaxID=181472 RepID=A0A672HSK4_SALFA